MSAQNQDYSMIIKDFLAMTQTTDQSVALNYLQESNWNLIFAVNKFNSKNQSGAEFSHDQVPGEPEPVREEEKKSLFSCFRSLFSCKKKVAVDNTTPSTLGDSLIQTTHHVQSTEKKIDEDDVFSFLPSKASSFEVFTSSLYRLIGVIIIYEKNDLEYIEHLINEILLSNEIQQRIKRSFVFYPILYDSEECQTVKGLLGINLIPLSFHYVFSPEEEIILCNDSLLVSTSGEKTTKELNKDLIEAESIRMIKKARPVSSLTKVIESQNEEFKKLEQMEKIKQEEEKENLEKEIKIKKEEEEKENKAIEEAKKRLPEEPSEGDPNATLIVFRYPDGENRSERRFLKTHLVKNLYDFVLTLGRGIYTEEENKKFTLIQPFPFHAYNEMEKTLEEEGLFPNAVLQIKEE